ncbi:hypothetical protein D3C86_1070200 [compost metagenome]
MNSHFQSSATTSTSSGATFDSIGRNGSSLCVVSQMMMPSSATITHGIPHTTTSIRVECDQRGAYSALVLPSRYRHANTSVRMITGITTISISAVASTIRFRVCTPMDPLGLSSSHEQPARLSGRAARISQRQRTGERKRGDFRRRTRRVSATHTCITTTFARKTGYPVLYGFTRTARHANVRQHPYKRF